MRERFVSNAAVEAYLKQTPAGRIDTGALGFVCALAEVAKVTPETARAVVNELADQRRYLKLIASENYSSLATQLAMGNLLTDKYAEGFAFSRFYEGCENVDTIEAYACEQARRLFNAEHAYVQPHSGADANMIAYWAVLTARVEAPALDALDTKDPMKLSREDWERIRRALGSQRLLGMDYYSGGHLTHGYRRNLSAKMFDAYSYAVNRETGLLDYDEIERMATEIRPLILLAGYSAYPREINFRRMREIADKVGAVFMVDMAHFAGLVAGGVFQGDADPSHRPRTKPCAARAAELCCARRNSPSAWTRAAPSSSAGRSRISSRRRPSRSPRRTGPNSRPTRARSSRMRARSRKRSRTRASRSPPAAPTTISC